jgi:hypothetical protein
MHSKKGVHIAQDAGAGVFSAHFWHFRPPNLPEQLLF